MRLGHDLFGHPRASAFPSPAVHPAIVTVVAFSSAFFSPCRFTFVLPIVPPCYQTLEIASRRSCWRQVMQFIYCRPLHRRQHRLIPPGAMRPTLPSGSHAADRRISPAAPLYLHQPLAAPATSRRFSQAYARASPSVNVSRIPFPIRMFACRSRPDIPHTAPPRLHLAPQAGSGSDPHELAGIETERSQRRARHR
jgi:hypothetical protein